MIVFHYVFYGYTEYSFIQNMNIFQEENLATGILNNLRVDRFLPVYSKAV